MGLIKSFIKSVLTNKTCNCTNIFTFPRYFLITVDVIFTLNLTIAQKTKNFKMQIYQRRYKNIHNVQIPTKACRAN